MIQPIFDEGQATPFGYQDFHLLAAEDGESPEEHIRRNERAVRTWLAQADAQGWVPTGLSFAGPRRLLPGHELNAHLQIATAAFVLESCFAH